MSHHFLPFWLFVASCPFIVAFCAFICFHVGFLWLYLLPFWPFVPSFAFMSAFCGFISFHFSLLWLYLLSCRLFVVSSSLHVWPFLAFGPSCPFILTFFLPKNATGLDLRPALEKRAFLRKRFKTKISSLIFLVLWIIISFHLGFLFLHVLHSGILRLHLLPCRLFVLHVLSF